MCKSNKTNSKKILYTRRCASLDGGVCSCKSTFFNNLTVKSFPHWRNGIKHRRSLRFLQHRNADYEQGLFCDYPECCVRSYSIENIKAYNMNSEQSKACAIIDYIRIPCVKCANQICQSIKNNEN
jgi:hypothetical protein